MAKVNWNIIGTGSYGLSSDTPSGTGKSLQVVPPLHFLYNGKTNITNAEVVWWTKLSWPNSDYGAVVLRSQSMANLDNCYLFYYQGGMGYFYKKVGGAFTLLSNVALSGMTSWKKFRVRVKGYDFTLEQWTGSAWSLILTAVDLSSQWSVGASGINGYTATAGYTVYFDDVSIGEEI